MSGVVSVGVAVGATAFAATDIAAAGLTLGTALEATAALGAAVSAVGAITHNKALTIAGAGLGLVGGVGAIASSAGLFGADTAGSLFGSSDVTAGAAGGTGAGGAFTGADAASMAGGAGLDVGSQGGVSDIIDSIANPMAETNASALTGITPNQTPVAAAASPNVTPDSAIPQGDGEGGTLGTTNNPAATTPDMNALGVPPAALNATPPTGMINGGVAAPAAPGMPAAPGTGNVTGTVTSTPGSLLNQGATTPAAPSVDTTLADAGKAAVQANTTNGPTGQKSLMDQLLGFASTSGGGRLLGGVVQAGSAFIAGATSTLTPAQVAALQAQANANQAAANVSQRQLSNMSQPIPTATRTAPPPSPNGIINRLPPPNGGPIVTGAPA
jgi:hypothetical protein